MKLYLPVWLIAFLVSTVGFNVPFSLGAAESHIVILQYHHFGSDTPPSTSTSLSQFEQHLDYLEKNGFFVLPLEKALLAIQNGQPLPEKSVAITIDDAYISVYTEAYPRLKLRQWPFTVFVATRVVDRRGSAFMTWDQMREMSRNGATFAAHSHTHPYMVRRKTGETEKQWRQRMLQEIRTSQQRLSEELGSNSKLFAYPYGEYNLALKDMVQELGLIGIAQNSGGIWTGSDFGALPRFPMGGVFAAMQGFRVKVNSLPLPVIIANPEDPILPSYQDKPVLRLELVDGDYRLESLACFASGQGRISVNWIDKDLRIFEVIPNRSIPEGRSRYNCTAVQRNSNRYYWYSHQWIKTHK